MDAQQSGTSAPPKPWERSGSSSGPTPFKPASAGNTSDVVEASGTARPGEIVTPDANTTAANRNALGRSLPARPWEQQQTYGNNSYMGGGYGSSSTYNSGYGSGTYGSNGGGMYGNSMYRGGMNGGTGSLYGGGMYGGGMYNSSFGGSMGGYGGMGMGAGMGMGMGMGMGGPPYGDQDPNNPFAAPSSPPGFWVSFMHVMQGVVTFFGRVAMLIDQNTQAFHMFMSALLQLFDRSGMLYGELARFVFRLLGIRTKSQKAQPPHPNGLPGPQNFQGGQNHIEGPKVAPSGAWDGVWGNE
ncbi:Peroxin-13 [Heracleum sosnowskyi]|uniref:Peroxin-13 n=1 Tax=Heracleum sosnowskyi TaxID=360622 RepID=A0AAD8J0L0_9APIA|nr:Peroxin-13 [Heracleum sosnowskyi]